MGGRGQSPRGDSSAAASTTQLKAPRPAVEKFYTRPRGAWKKSSSPSAKAASSRASRPPGDSQAPQTPCASQPRAPASATQPSPPQVSEPLADPDADSDAPIDGRPRTSQSSHQRAAADSRGRSSRRCQSTPKRGAASKAAASISRPQAVARRLRPSYPRGPDLIGAGARPKSA